MLWAERGGLDVQSGGWCVVGGVRRRMFDGWCDTGHFARVASRGIGWGGVSERPPNETNTISSAGVVNALESKCPVCSRHTTRLRLRHRLRDSGVSNTTRAGEAPRACRALARIRAAVDRRCILGASSSGFRSSSLGCCTRQGPRSKSQGPQPATSDHRPQTTDHRPQTSNHTERSRESWLASDTTNVRHPGSQGPLCYWLLKLCINDVGVAPQTTVPFLGDIAHRPSQGAPCAASASAAS